MAKEQNTTTLSLLNQLNDATDKLYEALSLACILSQIDGIESREEKNGFVLLAHSIGDTLMEVHKDLNAISDEMKQAKEAQLSVTQKRAA